MPQNVMGFFCAAVKQCQIKVNANLCKRGESECLELLNIGLAKEKRKGRGSEKNKELV